MFKHRWMLGVVVMAVALVWGVGPLMAQTDEKPQEQPKSEQLPKPQEKPKEQPKSQSEPTGKINLAVKVKGSHSSPGGNFPFNLSGDASVDAAVLSKGGNDALKAIFGGLSDSSNGDEKVTNVSGDLTVSDGKISGKVKIEWQVQGNGMWVSSSLEGTVSGNSVTINGKSVKVGGEWNWGGGVAQLGGKGSLSASSK